MNTTFDLKRVVLLLKRYFIEKWQWEVFYWAILIIILAITRNTEFVGVLLSISGLFYAVRITREIHSETNSTNYLMLPASTTEKTIALLLLSLVYYFAAFIIAYIAGNLLGNIILPGEDLNWSFFTTKNLVFIEEFDLMTSEYNNSFWHTILSFTCSQAMFLFAGIYFKKNAFAKTILAGTLFSILCIALFFLLLPNNLIFEHVYFLSMWEYFMDSFPYFKILKISTYISIPFFWFMSYLRLKEKEI